MLICPKCWTKYEKGSVCPVCKKRLVDQKELAKKDASLTPKISKEIDASVKSALSHKQEPTEFDKLLSSKLKSMFLRLFLLITAFIGIIVVFLAIAIQTTR